MISAARLGIGCAPSMRHAATCRLLGFVSQTWRGTRRFEELTRCAFAASSYVCARMYSYYILIHVFQTRSHTTRPPRPVARSTRADTANVQYGCISTGYRTDAPSLGRMEEQPHGEDSLSTTQTHCTGPGRAHVVCRTIRLYTSTRPTESRSPGPLASDLSSLELSFPLTRCRSTRRSGGHPL